MFHELIGYRTNAVSTLQCWSAVLPFDVAKTIIQTSPDKATETNPFKVLRSVSHRHLDFFCIVSVNGIVFF